MKKFIRISSLWLFVCAIVFLPQPSRASHIMGMDITYTCVGPHQYDIVINYYRDCAGIGAPGTVSVSLNSPTCGAGPTIVLTQLPGTGLEVSPLCPASLPSSTCSGGTLPGVQRYTYVGTVTLPGSCSDWIADWDECCRNAAVTNITGPGGRGMFIPAGINDNLAVCNSSPTFTTPPVPYICVGQPYCYNHGAVDPDGDSLVYDLVDPLEGTFPPGTVIPHTGGLTADSPFVASSISFDPLTGTLCVTPTAPQQCVVAIRVFEYRAGVLIGSVTRDIQVVVQACTNAQPNLVPNGIASLFGGILIDSNSVEVCPGDSIRLWIRALDANPGDVVTITSNILAVIPTASFSTMGINPDTAQITWVPTVADVGYYPFTITISDNGCPFLVSQTFSFDIRVVPSTYAGPDLYYCPSGGPVSATAVGGTIFTWNTLAGDATGISCTSCPNPVFDPAVTSIYEVVSNLSPTCKNRDTIVVNAVPDFTLNAGNDTTICKYGVAHIIGSATPALYAPYTWVWSPADSLTSTSVSDPYANPIVTTTYYATVTSDLGCTLTDSVQITISGIAPIVTIPPVDTVCQGSAMPIIAYVADDCGATSYACTGPNDTVQAGTNIAATNTLAPLHLLAGGNSQRKQYIVTRAELEAGGFIGGGKITHIAMEVNTVGTTNPDVAISMGCTNLPEFPNNNFITGLTLVRPSAAWAPVAGWNYIPLTTAYNWDGISNLIVEFCTNTAATGTASNISYGNSAPLNTANILNAGATPGACAIPVGARGTFRPLIRFRFCAAVPPGLTFTWTPATGLSNPAIQNPIATPATTTTYTLTVSDGLCSGADVVTVNVAPNFALSAGPDTTLCLNVPYLMQGFADPAFGPYTYAWTPTPTLSNPALEDPIATPLATTVYTLSVHSAAGCTKTDAMQITISGVAPIVNAGPNDTICPIGASAPLSANIVQPCGAGSGLCTTPTVTQVGNIEASVDAYGPFYQNTFLNLQFRRQYIIRASDLIAAGISGTKKISALAVNMATVGATNPDVVNLQISMGCTTKTQWTAGSDNFINGLTVVRTPITVVPVLGWNTITFTTPYIWDGVSNIVVEMCTGSNQLGSPSAINYDNVSYNGTLHQNIFGTGGCGLASGSVNAVIPVFRFSYCDATPSGLIYTWTPAAGLSNTTIPNPLADPAVTTTYLVTVDDGGSCIGQDFVTVVVDSTVYVEATATPDSLCVGDTAALNATVFGATAPLPLPSCGALGTPCTETPVTRTFGTGTFASANNSPFYQQYSDHRIQILYQASDLLSAGWASGTIQQLGWDVAVKTSTAPYLNFTIGIKCTTATVLTAGVFETGFTTVYSSASYSSALGWNMFTLTAPYDWDGSSNLLIQVCYDNVGVSNNDNVRYTSTTYLATNKHYTTGGTAGCLLAAPSTNFMSVANLRSVICPPEPPAFSYSWSPATGLSSTTIANPLATVTSPTIYTVTITGGACTVEDTVAIGYCVLPIEMMLLEGWRESSGVRLKWTTLNEHNTKHFEVEKSTDGGLSFGKLGQTPAGGNTTGYSTYYFFDENPVQGKNLYRLRQVDADGQFEYSNLAEVLFEDKTGLLSIYPNPSTENSGFTLEYFSDENASLKAELVDMWGRTIRTREYSTVAGVNQVFFGTQDVSQGTYFLRTTASGQTSVGKVLIVR